jgi:hypothetical protein
MESRVAPVSDLAAEESGDFVAIATYGHGAPTASSRAGIIIKEEAARRIGTAADRSAGAFDEEFGGGPGEGRKKPVETTFAGDELERPCAFLRDQLIVALGDAQDFVDRFGPGSGERLSFDNRREHGAETFAKAKNAQENSVNSMRFCVEKRAETGSAIL